MKNSRTNIIEARWTVVTLIYAAALLLSIVFSTLDLANDTTVYNIAVMAFMAISTICLTIVIVNKDDEAWGQWFCVIIGHVVALIIVLILAGVLMFNIKSITLTELFSSEASVKDVAYHYETLAKYTKATLTSIGFGFLVTVGSYVCAGIWKLLGKIGF